MKKLFGLLFFVVLVVGGAGLGVILVSDLEEFKPGEYGIVFTKLPSFLGGGLQGKILSSGEKEYVLPWEELFRWDTAVREITWGTDTPNKENDTLVGETIETRSKDGNEVGLAVTIQYSIDPHKLRYLVQYVGTNEESVKRLVTGIARSDIRTHLNALTTREFFTSDARNQAFENVKLAMNQRLLNEGIIVKGIIYQGHRFERRLEGGSYDRTYQEQIDLEQSTVQEVEKERLRIQVEEKRGEKRLKEAQGRYNQVIKAAEGRLRQAKYRGDQYYKAKQNESQRILKVGNNEIAALRKQVEALSGEGGKALLKLEIVRNLLKSNPNFILLNSTKSGQSGVDVNRVDTNELIRQISSFAAAQEGLPQKNLQAISDSANVQPAAPKAKSNPETLSKNSSEISAQSRTSRRRGAAKNSSPSS